MLRVSNVSFSYGEVPVITDVSLEVGDEQFVAIFGPNGHGKSTLLKTICGLLTARAGTVEYNGAALQGRPMQEIVNRGVVYIAEDRNLFPEMTVIENLKMGAYCRNARPREKENLELVFRLFPKLERFKNRYASTLSGGEARMLAIGRGLMSNPNFIAVDEPSLGLAPNLRVEVFKAIDQIRKAGVSILLVEQSTTIACEYADAIYILEDGRIVFQGSRDEVLGNAEVRKVFLGL